MDPRSGEVFGPLPGENVAGEELTEEKLREQLDLIKHKSDERLAETMRAAAHLAGGGKLVAVDADVVQRLRLGDRELQRRRRRR